MAFVIRASSFFVKHYLKVTDWGVVFMEGAAIVSKRKFNFQQIDYVLLSGNNLLSFQVGDEVFKIPVKAHKPKHVNAVNLLVSKVNGPGELNTGGFPVMQQTTNAYPR